MVFERGFVFEDWRSAVIILLYKVKEERSKCKNYRSIYLLIMVGKIYG